MDLSVIIVNYNVTEDVIQCIDSLHKNISNIQFEIIVIDNNSNDRSIESITNLYPGVKLICLKTNFGFGHANNVGMKAASGKHFLLINPDIVVQHNSVLMLYDVLNTNHTVGVVGPVQTKPDSGVEYYYTFFPDLYSRFVQEFGLYMKTEKMKKRFFDFLNDNIKIGKPFEVNWVIGSCMMLRKEIYESIGGFDEALFLYEEETEWQYRMNENKWIVMMVPEARVIHNHHSSTSKIGVMFILFQEYRSRIIFDLKRNDFFFTIIRRFMIFFSIVFRFLFYSITDFRTFELFKKRIALYLNLIKLCFTLKFNLSNSRFIFSDFQRYFINTGNAKI